MGLDHKPTETTEPGKGGWGDTGTMETVKKIPLLHKKGSEENLDNFRGISVNSNIEKSYARAIWGRMGRCWNPETARNDATTVQTWDGRPSRHYLLWFRLYNGNNLSQHNMPRICTWPSWISWKHTIESTETNCGIPLANWGMGQDIEDYPEPIQGPENNGGLRWHWNWRDQSRKRTETRMCSLTPALCPILIDSGLGIRMPTETIPGIFFANDMVLMAAKRKGYKDY